MAVDLGPTGVFAFRFHTLAGDEFTERDWCLVHRLYQARSMQSISLALKDAFHSWGDNPHGGPHRREQAVLARSPNAGSSGRRGLRQDNRRGQIQMERAGCEPAAA